MTHTLIELLAVEAFLSGGGLGGDCPGLPDAKREKGDECRKIIQSIHPSVCPFICPSVSQSVSQSTNKRYITSC